MKKIFAGFLITFLFLFAAPLAYANQNTPQKITTLNSEEVVEGDYFASGDIVEVYGEIEDDAYIAGGQITIDGNIGGDLLVAGGTVNIRGNVDQDVRVAGGQITISADVGQNLTVLGGNVEITDSANIAGNIVAGAGNLNINAPIDGNVKGGAGTVNLNSNIDGSVEMGVGQLRLSPEASVAGNLTYWSEEKASISDTATVSGNITMRKAPTTITGDNIKIDRQFRDMFRNLRYSARVISTISAFIVGLILIKLYPNFLKTSSEKLREKTWASLGIGFASLILTPIAAAILLATVIGIPLGMMLFAAYFVYIYLAKIAVSFWAGTFVVEKAGLTKKDWYSLGIGLVIYLVLTLIPVLRGFVSFSALIFGLGAMLLSCRQIYENAKAKGVV